MTAATPAPVLTLEARHVTTLEQVERWTTVARRLGFGSTAQVAFSSINATAAVSDYLSRAKVEQ
jgi:hypothetical protein